MNPQQIVLGSQSPQRLQLLKYVAGSSPIVVRPPLNSDEPGFDGISRWADIVSQLQNIAALKHMDVRKQSATRDDDLVVTADTIIVSGEQVADGTVLGKPPEPDWQPAVRRWFNELLLGQTHRAATAIHVSRGGKVLQDVVTTHVLFHAATDVDVEWYLTTEESRGKAGGYAIQGAGSMLVRRIDGSLSNVVGLPLNAVKNAIAQLCD